MAFYHEAAIVAANVEKGKGLRSQLYSSDVVSNKKNLPKISFLVSNVLQRKNEIDQLITSTGLKQTVHEKDLWLVRILVTEIVLGRKSYKSEGPVMKKVIRHKAKLKEAAAEMKLTKKPEILLPRYVRVDLRKVALPDAHKYLQNNGYALAQNVANFKELSPKSYYLDQHVPALLVFHPKAAVHELDWVTSGKLILQDKSSCLVAPLLAPHPCSTVLDMCAAPGFKTQHVASLTHGLGRIIAVDKNADRYKALCQLKEKFSLHNLICVHSDVLRTENLDNFKDSVEYILLDPPCSGSGMAKNYDFSHIAKLDGSRYGKLHNLQAKMLRSALTDYPAVRRVTYSTCSITEEENEAVIDEFLDDIPGGFILVDLSPFYPGLSRGLLSFKCGSKCIRLSPESDATNGFFIAVFERPNPPALPTRPELPQRGVERLNADSLPSKRKKSRNCSVESGNADGESIVVEAEQDFTRGAPEIEVDSRSDLSSNDGYGHEEDSDHELNRDENSSPESGDEDVAGAESLESSSSEGEIEKLGIGRTKRVKNLPADSVLTNSKGELARHVSLSISPHFRQLWTKGQKRLRGRNKSFRAHKKIGHKGHLGGGRRGR